jgi:hypothetical protein
VLRRLKNGGNTVTVSKKLVEGSRDAAREVTSRGEQPVVPDVVLPTRLMDFVTHVEAENAKPDFQKGITTPESSVTKLGE